MINKEEAFVKIITVFDTNEDRTIERMSMIYHDHTRLKKYVEQVLDIPFIESVRNKKVLIKPNWVMEDTQNMHRYCLRANDNLLLAFLDVLLAYSPSSVVIADAPVQGAIWNKIVTTELRNQIEALGVRYQVPIEIKDLRRKIMEKRSTVVHTDLHPLSEYVILDVGEKSILEPLSTEGKPFRVLGYDYRKTNKEQCKGTHKYCISKELFEADIVISMPKVKTHQKTGLTAALKNLVGLNGDKDYLPHHRLGGTGFGGDCYPGKNLLRLTNERIIDYVNRIQGTWGAILFRLIARMFWELSFPGKLDNRGAAWYGNDTCWRMVTDLNTIAIYGKSDGTISAVPQRKIYSFCDGIIGGQGNGPLQPEPLALGILSFTNSSALNDACMARLMGFDIHKIPLVDFSLRKIRNSVFDISINGEKKQKIEELSSYSVHTKAAPGWEECLNKQK